MVKKTKISFKRDKYNVLYVDSRNRRHERRLVQKLSETLDHKMNISQQYNADAEKPKAIKTKSIKLQCQDQDSLFLCVMSWAGDT